MRGSGEFFAAVNRNNLLWISRQLSGFSAALFRQALMAFKRS